MARNRLPADRNCPAADLSPIDLLIGDSLAFHWHMTCSNNVIEGEAELEKVPEPGTLGLASLAFAGLLLMHRRTKTA
ncbi:PEP-CTERM sorting domain-containing protein [Marinobacter sp. CHS3-4]|uniref:PEP-CTERM sorting domain-containing protein n=1 Tax=Marinobacter sp. CHS3-4 TaxID=3045174 RepID=UPI0024B51C81|nr:PEP-CTERM sorting domain-containing protein [Marinobacter sp. CHS3-4]MDI9245564.1 PEP-CTERM sorting domain-containing protein [Marinobacter sp. CHS3-4]